MLSVTTGGGREEEAPGGGSSEFIERVQGKYNPTAVVRNDCVVLNDTSTHHMAGKTDQLFQPPCRHYFLPAPYL